MLLGGSIGFATDKTESEETNTVSVIVGILIFMVDDARCVTGTVKGMLAALSRGFSVLLCADSEKGKRRSTMEYERASVV